MKTTIEQRIRRRLLEWRAQGSNGFGLSYLVQSVASDLLKPTKAERGKVQKYLADLAIQGVLFTRRGPERAVMPYEHCETDKRFRFRITEAEARVQLKKLGHSVPRKVYRSVHLTKSLRGY